jgi:hypothetical protein
MSGSLLLTVYHPGCASRASELLSVRYVITYQDVYAASHCELHTGRVPTCQPHHSMRQTVTLTRNGSLLCSQSGRSRKPRCFNFWHRAPAATPSVVSLTRERRIELCAIALRAPPFAPHELLHGKLWFASRARSLRPLIHSPPSGCASRTKDVQTIDSTMQDVYAAPFDVRATY